MKKNLIFFALLLIFWGCSNHHETKETLSDNQAIKVKIETVSIYTGKSILHYSGTVEPSQTIPLTFQSTGIVTKVLVQEGDMVVKGQLLACTDKSDNQNLYNAASAKYNQAKDAYIRLKSVYEKGSLTEIKWVEMETNLKQAESQMQLTQSNLEKCNLRSPDNGMIGHRNIEPGQSSINPTAPIELVKIETVAVKIAVPENEISKIHKGQKASFSISALEDKTFEGTVTNVGIVADRISRTYEVKITAQNKNLRIKPGMVCDVNLNNNNISDVIVIPNTAVSKSDNGDTYVYVISNDKKHAVKQIITIGNYNDTGIEVLKGLIEGANIVVEGKEKLTDNSLIRL